MHICRNVLGKYYYRRYSNRKKVTFEGKEIVRITGAKCQNDYAEEDDEFDDVLDHFAKRKLKRAQMIVQLTDVQQFQKGHYRGQAVNSLCNQCGIVLVPIFSLQFELSVYPHVQRGSYPIQEGQNKEKYHDHLEPVIDEISRVKANAPYCYSAHGNRISKNFERIEYFILHGNLSLKFSRDIQACVLSGSK